MEFEKDLEATELRLGLPGNTNQELETRQASNPITNLPKSNKRQLSDSKEELSKLRNNSNVQKNKMCVSENIPLIKAQVVGWPPVRSHMKNCLQAKKKEGEGDGIFVKVSMDGAPYLRKIDLKLYKTYPELFKALENMFKFQVGGNLEGEGYNNGLAYVPTYKDKDGDWMLVGDVPWDMFVTSCMKLRIVKGSEAQGLGNQ